MIAVVSDSLFDDLKDSLADELNSKTARQILTDHNMLCYVDEEHGMIKFCSYKEIGRWKTEWTAVAMLKGEKWEKIEYLMES